MNKLQLLEPQNAVSLTLLQLYSHHPTEVHFLDKEYFVALTTSHFSQQLQHQSHLLEPHNVDLSVRMQPQIQQENHYHDMHELVENE